MLTSIDLFLFPYSKPVKLEPRDKNGDVIIVASKGPAVLVDIKSNELCIITGLKMSHIGKAPTM